MASSRASFLFLILAAARVLFALEVTSGSPCATYCLDLAEGDGYDPTSSSTNTTDITCRDDGYSKTEAGMKFKNCMECLQDSTVHKGSESDAKWFICTRFDSKLHTTMLTVIDNLRYTLTTCLFSKPEPPLQQVEDTPCIIDHACKPLMTPLTFDNLTGNPDETWDYCTADDGSFMAQSLWPCISCLETTDDQTYLSNCKQTIFPGQ